MTKKMRPGLSPSFLATLLVSGAPISCESYTVPPHMFPRPEIQTRVASKPPLRMAMKNVAKESYQNDIADLMTDTKRRVFFKAASAASLCFVLGYGSVLVKPVMAFLVDDGNGLNPEDDFILHIKATFPKGFSVERLDPEDSLTITVKPAISYNKEIPLKIPSSLFTANDGMRVPLVLKSEHSKAALLSSMNKNADELTITFTSDELTPEGTDMTWWAHKPLIVSADIADLEGCKILLNRNGIGQLHQLTIPLQKRGICYDFMAKS